MNNLLEDKKSYKSNKYNIEVILYILAETKKISNQPDS